MRHRIAAAVISVALGLPLYAQDTSAHSSRFTAKKTDVRVRKRSAEQMRRLVDFIPAWKFADPLGGTADVLGMTVHTSGDEQTNFQLVRRRSSSQPEVHARWDDLMVIRSGAGTLITGDSLVGSTYRAPGERRGGRFNKQSDTPIRAGDVVRIPAAVPHAVPVSGTEPLEYLLIKQRRQELPIRWFKTP